MAKQSKQLYYRKRLAETGEAVRNVIVIIWMEELENLGKGYYDLVAYMDALHIEACISPVHDKDVWDSQAVLDWCSMRIDPETGDLKEDYIDKAPYVGKTKKSHIHMLIKGPSQQKATWWSELMSGLIPDMNPMRWDKCFSIKGSMRYWAHMDSRDKYRYSEWDIIGIAGIDLSSLSKRDDKTNDELANMVYDLIKIYKCEYYYEVLDIANDLGDAELVSYIRGTHSLWRSYLDSKIARAKNEAIIKKVNAQRKKAEKEAEMLKTM